MYKFPKIAQFANIVKLTKTRHDFVKVVDGSPVYEHTSPYPTIKYEGTVKLHGTNGSVVFDADLNMTMQSKSRVISVEKDNAGFAAYVSEPRRKEALKEYAKFIRHYYDLVDNETIVLFMEWCGGNIQKGVALEDLPKMCVLFSHVRIIDHSKKIMVFDVEEDVKYWVEAKTDGTISPVVDTLNTKGIHFITQFPTFEIEVDFNAPELAQNKIVELVLAVEKECPVCKELGVSGFGEGIVWKNAEDPSSDFWFKAKGDKHSASKVKKIAAVDIEKVNNVNEFVTMTATDNRLNQGLEHLKEMGLDLDRKNTGDYIRWVISDILAEEVDLLTTNGLCAKDVGGAISKVAKEFLFDAINKSAFN